MNKVVKKQNELREKHSDVIEKLFLFKTDDDLVELNQIRLIKQMQNAGWGNVILNDLTDWADENDIILHLTPSDTWGSNVKRLTQFYKSYGFVRNTGKHRDFRTKDTMIRYPK